MNILTKEQKLEIYRDFILQFNEWLAEGDVQVSSCRVMFSIQFGRLIKDATAAKEGTELPEIGTTCMLTETESKELKEELDNE